MLRFSKNVMHKQDLNFKKEFLKRLKDAKEAHLVPGKGGESIMFLYSRTRCIWWLMKFKILML